MCGERSVESLPITRFVKTVLKQVTVKTVLNKNYERERERD